MASALDTVHAQATDMLRHTEAMQKRMTRAPDLDDSEQGISVMEVPPPLVSFSYLLVSRKQGATQFLVRLDV